VSSLDNHGTTVAGVAAALANGIQSKGSTGIAPNVGLVSIRTQTSASTDPRRIVNALVWAETIGARVSNYSWNSATPPLNNSCAADKFFETRAAGMVHFSSAGNKDEFDVFWPANIPTVNAVSAVDSTGNRWVDTPGFGSNYGAQVFVSAPGGNIYTTDRMGTAGYSDSSNYSIVSGTSYAAPFAAGVAALILSQRPDLSADAVEAILCKSATDLGQPGIDIIHGCGMVNARRALEIAAGVIFIDRFESGDERWWSTTSP